MYANPKHLRDHPIKVRFDEPTARLIDALAEFNRVQPQPAVLVRELVLESLEKRQTQLAHDCAKSQA